MSPRLGRVSVRLIAACSLVAALIGAAIAITLAASKDPEEVSSQHREYREVADEQFSQKNWTESQRNYEELVAADPFDGAALRGLAMSLTNERREIWAELKEAKQELSDDSDRSELDPYYEREKQISELAIEHFERLLDFARYRDQALERLAAIHSCLSRLDGEKEHAEVAVGYLRTLLDEGGSTEYGVQNMAEFKFLSQHPEFEALAEQEMSLGGGGHFRRGGFQDRRFEHWYRQGRYQ